ncbi:MAG: PAS domain-containing protein [Polyangiaceae bacterium]|nr:PAS domain-containing protein [Polyangiaceae bacterium]
MPLPEAVLESITDAVAVLDAAGDICFKNGAWSHLGGLAAFGGEGPREALREGLFAVLSGARERFDADLEHDADPSGAPGKRHFAVTITPCPIAGGRGALVQQRDVSEVQQLIRSLRASEQSLSAAQRIAHVGNWEWDIRDGSLIWSDETYRIFGLTPQEFVATFDAFLVTVHPDDRDAVTGAVQGAIRERAPYCLEYRIVRPTGEERVVEAQGEAQYDDHGEPLRMIGTLRDTTAQKKAELLIRAQAKALLEVSTPLLPVSDDVVVLPLIGEIDAARAQRVMDTLLDGIERRRASIAILDVTGVPAVDTFTAEALIRSARAARLLGVEVLLTGVRPDVAQALVSLSVDLQGIVTLNSLQRGIAHALQRTREKPLAKGSS